MASYVQERNLPVIWYTLHDNDGPVHIFLSRLSAAISERAGRPAPALPAAQNNSSLQDELAPILKQLRSWPGELHILIDNIHVLHDMQDVPGMLEALFDLTPPNIHFVLIGQKLPNLSYAVYKVRRSYAALTNKELVFTQTEVAAFFRDGAAAPLTDMELELIWHKTGGWPASLELIRDAVQGRSREERSRMLSRIPDIPYLYDYLASEVFDLQPLEIQGFLLKTSIMHELHPWVIGPFMDQPHLAVPEHLTSRFLFIQKTRDGIFTYHPLFRAFLYDRYRQQTGEAEIEADHLQLSAIYERRHHYFHAFGHSILGGDYIHAGRLMHNLTHRYEPQHFIVLMEKWLEEFFSYQSIASSIFLYRCIPLSILQNLVQPLEQTLSALQQSGQSVWVAMVQQQLAGIYMLMGELNTALRLFEAALSVFRQVQDRRMEMLNLNLQADLLLNMRQTERAKQYARRCLFLAESEGTDRFHPYALSGMADVLLEDEPDLAAGELEKAMDSGHHRDDTLMLFLCCSRSRWEHLHGQAQQAVAWGMQALAAAEKYGFGYDIGLANYHLAYAYMDEGKWSEAESCLTRAYTVFQDYPYYLATVIAARCELEQLQGREEQALEVKAELEQLCRQKHYPWLLEQVEAAGERPQVEKATSTTFSPPLKIEALGPLRIQCDGRQVQVKRKASLRLLLYLIVHYGRRVSQEVLLEELFPDVPLAAAQNQLNVALSVLRSTLQPERTKWHGRKSGYLLSGEGLYWLDPELVTLDANDFVKNSEPQGSRDITLNLTAVEQLYRGDLLEEYRYEPFITAERERLRIRYMQALNTLAVHYAAQGDGYRSMEYYEKLCASDPHHLQNHNNYLHMLEHHQFRSKAAEVAAHIQRISQEW
ncbi:hypothetical protein KC345_g6062 [Hortaea werneckii]|nr:hypothetical protein KC345_g6062 [Hortaea werneckii]